MISNSPKHNKIIGVKVSITNESEVINFVENCLKNKQKFFITTPNPEIIVQAQNDQDLMEAINSSDLALPDGIGLKLSGINSRVTGRGVFESLLNLGSSNKLKVYLLGASKEVNQAAVKKAQKICSGAKIKGSPGPQLDIKAHYVTDSDKEIEKDIIKHINNFKPQILFVAFGHQSRKNGFFII